MKNAKQTRKTMKKLSIIASSLAVIIISTVITSGCALTCNHEWVEATCETPKTCSLCGKTEGSALEHDWSTAECGVTPVCTRCSISKSTPNSHNMIDATCETAAHCSLCGFIDGEALGHDWIAATCTESATCSRCGQKDGNPLGHQWIEATCKEPQKCSICGITNGTATSGHDLLANRFNTEGYSEETDYSVLYSYYQELLNHENKNKCGILSQSLYTSLFNKMLYGEWKDSNGNYITYQSVFSDYNNTKSSTWYGTNLTTSKISGNQYYYYIDASSTGVTIGYEDKITGDKTDNFNITFNQDSITVYNNNNGRTYNLTNNTSFQKVVKGNAKLAYIYIAKKITSFKNPSSVKVTACHVDYDTKKVYATIQATNGFGATTSSKYVLYEIGGYYYITESSLSYSSNIDISELNTKLQNYLANY